MHKRKQKLFKQLEDQKIAKNLIPIIGDYPRMIEPFSYGYLGFSDFPSDYPKDSLGYLADQLKKSPDLIIEQFAEAGVLCLTPFHRVTEEDKRALLQYFKNKHSGELLKTECLYSKSEVDGLKIEIVQSITEELLRNLCIKRIQAW